MTTGSVFPEWDPAVHVVEADRLDSSWERRSALAWGFMRPYCVLHLAISVEGRVACHAEAYGYIKPEDGDLIDHGVMRNASDVADQEFRRASSFQSRSLIVDRGTTYEVDANERIRDGNPTPTIASTFRKAGWSVIPADTDRAARKLAVHSLLQTILPDGKPMLQVFDSCEHLIRTLPTLKYSLNSPSDVDEWGNSKPYEALSLFAGSLAIGNLPSRA